jgi:hypothetical protein
MAALEVLEVAGCAAVSVCVGLVAGPEWAVGAAGALAIVLANTLGEK